MTTKRVLAIHDMCSFGRCSLTAALPVISSMGIQVCPFPTALFSNNLTYGTFTFTDFTPHMQEFMDKWQELGYTYDAIYSGFLADGGQTAIVAEAAARFGTTDTLIVVDPAMADDGALYPVFSTAFVGEMRKLIGKATVITPNYTEACLLLDRPYSADVLTTKEVTDVCRQLTQLGPRQVVITSVPGANDEIRNISYDSLSASFNEEKTYRIPFSTCGTGDIFTSVLTGALLRGKTLHDAVKTATTFLSHAISYTYKAKSDYREGVQVEPCLKELVKLCP